MRQVGLGVSVVKKSSREVQSQLKCGVIGKWGGAIISARLLGARLKSEVSKMVRLTECRWNSHKEEEEDG